MSITLLSSPLQGFTECWFRNAVDKYFGGIDSYYAPYIRLKGSMEIKNSYQRDLNPTNNTVSHLIPQIMTSKAEEFLHVVDYVQSLGYNELNWNLGCPYPMVTKQGMGSGLICETEKIESILDEVHSKTDIVVSLKMRMGYDNSDEILKTLPMLEKFPIKNIGIHARIGKQLYKGGVDWDAFERCLEYTTHKIYYNGDITSVETFHAAQDRFPSIDHWMIGRGLIADPFLPGMIKANTSSYPEDRIQRFKSFHDEIYRHYDQVLSGTKQTMMKMHSFWEYFELAFIDTKKGMKKIKKAKNLNDYAEGVDEILSKLEEVK